MSVLEIKNLHVGIDGKEIVKGLNLTINPGETHAIMGPNGTGKSTLSYALMGHPNYEVTEGEIWLRAKISLGWSRMSAHGWGFSWPFSTRLPSPV